MGTKNKKENKQINKQASKQTSKQASKPNQTKRSFEANVYVVVTAKKSNELWKVEGNKIVGYVPSSYLKKPEISQDEEVSTIRQPK